VFWCWFPFGIAGIRTFLLFIPAFMIFILRVAQLHVGYRTSYSAWDTFRTNAGKFQVVQTLSWYALSAYLFSEIYIWSAPKSADLNRIKLIPKTDRTTLNEQPIYLTGYLVFLAGVQSAIHLYYDYDRLDMPSAKTKLNSVADENLSPIVPPAAQLRAKFIPMLSNSFRISAISTFVSPILYSLPFGFWPYSIRKLAWGFTRSFAKIFWNLPKSGSLPATKPFHWTMLMRTLTAGCMLLMMWEVGNAAFTAYVAQEPLKNDRPITYESRDPNGSLLTGLKGKKLQTRVCLNPSSLRMQLIVP
jgi:nucleoporin NDC1